jgi:hypothetical protein
VALKLLSPELAGSERFRDRFPRESKLAASIDHPNIVPIYDAHEVDGELFIAMRYVEGSDLKETIRAEERLDPERTSAIVPRWASPTRGCRTTRKAADGSRRCSTAPESEVPTRRSSGQRRASSGAGGTTPRRSRAPRTGSRPASTAAGWPAAKCWLELDQYLTTEIVSRIPLFVAQHAQVVSERVIGYSFDQWTGLPALDRLALARGSE